LQIARLSRDMEALQGVHHSLEAELDVARLVERGTARYVERVETRMQAEQAQTRRLLVLMGSLQRENERLASRVDNLQARLGRIEPARERHSLWKRIGAALFHAPAILPGRTA
ncbi:MAG TPA: hypothetical protein PLJ12_15645, partial [Planctomycetota bacterium]|nr:hypothetical protein [Planctomycetota bacterium]